MQNKIWFFGDCFTWGAGCRPEQPYYQWKKPEDKLWTEIVSDYFNMIEEKPFYKMGATMYIIVNFIRALKNIKKGDIVIISDSDVKSTLSISRNKKNISSIQAYRLEGFEQWHNEEEKQIVTSFIDNQVKPYEKIWEKFYIDLIKNLAYELKNRGINTLFWSHYEWKNDYPVGSEKWLGNNKYETIFEATNNEIKDQHFSWKGNKQFANYIINRIENKEWLVNLI